MARTKIDVRSLRGALDQARQSKDLSWRQLAADADVTPSLLSRLRNGYKPDADGFMTLVTWLGMPAERFLINEDSPPARKAELTSELVPLLRASKLDDDDIAMLQAVIQAMLKRAAARDDDDRQERVNAILRMDGAGEPACGTAAPGPAPT